MRYWHAGWTGRVSVWHTETSDAYEVGLGYDPADHSGCAPGWGGSVLAVQSELGVRAEWHPGIASDRPRGPLPPAVLALAPILPPVSLPRRGSPWHRSPRRAPARPPTPHRTPAARGPGAARLPMNPPSFRPLRYNNPLRTNERARF